MIAGKAAGVFDDLAEVASRSALPAAQPLQPEEGNHTLYRRYVDNYIEWQAKLADTFGLVSQVE
jgi:hypothetical protein